MRNPTARLGPEGESSRGAKGADKPKGQTSSRGSKPKDKDKDSPPSQGGEKAKPAGGKAKVMPKIAETASSGATTGPTGTGGAGASGTIPAVPAQKTSGGTSGASAPPAAKIVGSGPTAKKIEFLTEELMCDAQPAQAN